MQIYASEQLRKFCRSMQMRLMTKILNLCGCSHILEIVFQIEDILLRRNAFLC